MSSPRSEHSNHARRGLPHASRARDAGDDQVSGKTAIVITLHSDSIFQGHDLLMTVSHPTGIFYFVFVAPASEAQYAMGISSR